MFGQKTKYRVEMLFQNEWALCLMFNEKEDAEQYHEHLTTVHQDAKFRIEPKTFH